MELVLAIPELIDMIMDGDLIGEITIIAKLRMVNVFARDLFATQTRAQTKTRGTTTFTATIYTVRGIFGREPYYRQLTVCGFLDKIWHNDRSCMARVDDPAVLHSHAGAHDMMYDTGFAVSPAEFIAVNRLFGLKSESYDRLLCGDTDGKMDLEITTDGEYLLTVYFADDVYILGRILYTHEVSSTYYLFRGQIYGCAADIGDYHNLVRLRALTW